MGTKDRKWYRVVFSQKKLGIRLLVLLLLFSTGPRVKAVDSDGNRRYETHIRSDKLVTFHRLAK